MRSRPSTRRRWSPPPSWPSADRRVHLERILTAGAGDAAGRTGHVSRRGELSHRARQLAREVHCRSAGGVIHGDLQRSDEGRAPAPGEAVEVLELLQPGAGRARRAGGPAGPVESDGICRTRRSRFPLRSGVTLGPHHARVALRALASGRARVTGRPRRADGAGLDSADERIALGAGRRLGRGAGRVEEFAGLLSYLCGRTARCALSFGNDQLGAPIVVPAVCTA